MTTGGADALECFLRRIGIADTEFTSDAGTGRVHLYEGGDGTNSFMTGGTFSAATTLWSSPTKLANYDMIGFSCEGSTSKFVDQKPQTSVDNIVAYANSGGRLFFGHYHFYWLQQRDRIQRHRGLYREPHGAHHVRIGPDRPHRQPDVPEGNGARAVAGGTDRGGELDAGSHHGRGPRALGHGGDPADDRVDLPADEPAGLAAPALGAVPELRDAGRNAAGEPVRKGHVHRHAHQERRCRRSRARAATIPIRASRSRPGARRT